MRDMLTFAGLSDTSEEQSVLGDTEPAIEPKIKTAIDGENGH